MPKDILLLGSIQEYNAMYFYDQIAEATEDDATTEMVLRINCEGGSPEYGMSIIEKVQELAEQISIKVSGMAHSMALFILCYVDRSRVEVLDTTQSVLHRASYGEWCESQPWFKGSIFSDLMARSNKDLEKAFRAAVNVEVLEALPQFKSKNITLKDIFDTETRIEVLLSGADLKKIGLAGRVTKVTPAKSAELKTEFAKFAKCRSLEDFKLAAKADPPKPQETPKPTSMTLAELKAQFPGTYNEIFALGQTAGVAQEKDRVETCLVFVDVDPKTVKEVIESGKPLTGKQMAELSLKATQKPALDKLAAATADVKVETVAPAGTQTDAEKKLEAASTKMMVSLGVGKKAEVTTVNVGA